MLILCEQWFELYINVSVLSEYMSRYMRFAPMPLINKYAGVSNKTSGLNLNLSLYLHPCFDNTNREGSGEYAQTRLPEPSLLEGATCLPPLKLKTESYFSLISAIGLLKE